MPLLDERPLRASAATYRRRRIVVGAGLALVISLIIAGASLVRPGGDVLDAGAEPMTAADGTTDVDAGSPDRPASDETNGEPDVPAPTATVLTRGEANATEPNATDPSATVVTTAAVTTTASTSSSTTTVPSAAGHASSSAFLACVRDRESRGSYAAVSPDGQFFGAYQIDQVTWNNTTLHAGLDHLYAVQPNFATAAGQDQLAMALLEWQGAGPWAGGCWP